MGKTSLSLYFGVWTEQIDWSLVAASLIDKAAKVTIHKGSRIALSLIVNLQLWALIDLSWMQRGHEVAGKLIR